MSDLIKSITTISVNDVLEEAFEAAVETTPSNTDLMLSYDPGSKTIGKSLFPANATTIAVEAKAEAAEALQLAQGLSASLKTTSVNTDRVLTFTGDKTIPLFTSSSNVIFTADYTNAKDNCSTVFKVLLNNGAIPILPPEFEEYAGSYGFVDGVVNTVICFRIAGSYGFICIIKKLDIPANNTNPVVVGATTVTAGMVDQNTAVINWTAANNATSYTVERYLNADYSDTPIVIYPSDLALTFIDAGLTPNTNYFYKVTPSNGIILGATGTLSIKTSVSIFLALYFADFRDSANNTNMTDSANVTNGNIHWLGARGYFSSTYPVLAYQSSVNYGFICASLLGEGFLQDITYKITVTGLSIITGYLGGSTSNDAYNFNQVDDFINPTVVGDSVLYQFTATGNAQQFFFHVDDVINTDSSFATFKIEKI